ncbi:hypothetical protein KSP39_PZI000331 [Platanthera zijinensis]|uniref:Uncharacterized protein n=1 Tax=Platanthera zijinensis TaxID=2320716 RepID=A0AAP0C1J6_9ASPA
MKLWVEDEDERKAEKACRMQLTVLNDALHEFLDKHYQGEMRMHTSVERTREKEKKWHKDVQSCNNPAWSGGERGTFRRRKRARSWLGLGGCERKITIGCIPNITFLLEASGFGGGLLWRESLGPEVLRADLACL